MVQQDGRRIGDIEYRQLFGGILLQQEEEHCGGSWRGCEVKDVSFKMGVISDCLCANGNNLVERKCFIILRKDT